VSSLSLSFSRAVSACTQRLKRELLGIVDIVGSVWALLAVLCRIAREKVKCMFSPQVYKSQMANHGGSALAFKFDTGQKRPWFAAAVSLRRF